MKFIIQYLNQDGSPPAEYALAMGQTISFGSSAMADIRLPLADMDPCIFAEVSFSRSGCVISRIASKESLVSVNGNELNETDELKPGDFFDIGPYPFQIELAGTDHFLAQDHQSIDELPFSMALCSVAVNSIVSKHTPEDPDWTIEDVLEKLFRDSNAFLFANFKFASVEQPQSLDIGDDLYAEAPDEVRDMYSLHAVRNGEPGKMLELALEVLSRDAGLVAIPELTADECLNDSKLFRAWLARPSVLEMFLKESSTELCGKLLQPFRGLILPNQEFAESWVVYSNGECLVDQIIPGSQPAVTPSEPNTNQIKTAIQA